MIIVKIVIGSLLCWGCGTCVNLAKAHTKNTSTRVWVWIAVIIILVALGVSV